MSESPHSSRKQLSLKKIAIRIVTIIVAAYCVSFVIAAANRYFEREHGPAGFARGMLHGATMPAAMPNLAFGKNVDIYAVNNNGLPYKLGYTMGVNICGAIFFGLFFMRISRWNKSRAKSREEPLEVAR